MPTIRPNVLETATPTTFEMHNHLTGPNPNDPCLCGSGDPAAYCHRSSEGRWFAAPGPLLTDLPTGYPHPRCYANSSNDCSPKLTNEHWLSKGILEEIADPMVKMSGLRWANGETKDLPPNTLGSNILCERHNRALSSLDTTALRAFRAIHEFDATIKDPTLDTSRIAVICGEHLELWLLKLAWGAMVANMLRNPATEEPRIIRPLPDHQDWTEVLFRGAKWPKNWGLYAITTPDLEVTPMGPVQLEPKFAPDGNLWAMAVEIGPVAFHLCLGRPETDGWNHTRHPGGIVLQRSGTGNHNLLALTWRNGGNNPMFLTRMSDGIAARSPSGSPR